MLDGIQVFSTKIFEKLGWSYEETDVFLADVRKKMKTEKPHVYATL